MLRTMFGEVREGLEKIRDSRYFNKALGLSRTHSKYKKLFPWFINVFDIIDFEIPLGKL